jgi:hypothetical protein
MGVRDDVLVQFALNVFLVHRDLQKRELLAQMPLEELQIMHVTVCTGHLHI